MKKIAILILLVLLLAACRAEEEVGTAVVTQNFLGYDVIDAEQKVIGQLEEVILDAESQQIAYGVVIVPRAPYSYKGASVASPDLHVAVPWSHLTLNVTAKQFVLSATADEVYAAPLLPDLEETLVLGWDTAVKDYWQPNSH
ncbi:MAG: PRC-barrel domain-containing protein [Ardenticatenaceae bacterium]|nr:PRC-barrel domain-containing protein [Ardenticatenaceae bacterium]